MHITYTDMHMFIHVYAHVHTHTHVTNSEVAHLSEMGEMASFKDLSSQGCCPKAESGRWQVREESGSVSDSALDSEADYSLGAGLGLPLLSS